METEIVTCPNCGKRNRVAAAAAGKPRCANCGQWLPWITAADDVEFTEVVEKSSVPVLVDLWAAWCGPCRMAAPEVARTAELMAGRAVVLKVDTERHPELGARYRVNSIPNFVILKEGRVVAQDSGVVGAAELSRRLQTAM